MDSPQELDESNAKATGSKTKEGNAAPSKAVQKLKLIAGYALMAIAPILSVLALVVAGLAVNGNKTSQEEFNKVSVKIDNLTASLSESKSELMKLQMAMAQEKARQEEERKKQDELITKIMQNVTPLQVKLKIHPTLEEQLHQPLSAAAVIPAPAVATSHAASPAPAKAAAAAGDDKKPSPQVQAMKDAIEKFNKK